jgi:hypothetical protein
MCEPATLIAMGTAAASFASANAGAIALGSVALSGGSAIASYMGQKQAATAQERTFEQNKMNALTAMGNDIEANNLTASAADENATGRRMAASGDGLFARSAARTSAGERGIGGLTAAALEADIGFSEGQQVAAINRNSELDSRRHALRGRGVTDSAQSRIQATAHGKQPSLLALGAKLGATAFNGLRMSNDLTDLAAPKGPSID